MFKVINILVKPSSSVEFPSEIPELKSQMEAALNATAGFISIDRKLSDDMLKQAVTVRWNSNIEYEKFKMTQNAILETLATYNTDNEIIVTRFEANE